MQERGVVCVSAYEMGRRLVSGWTLGLIWPGTDGVWLGGSRVAWDVESLVRCEHRVVFKGLPGRAARRVNGVVKVTRAGSPMGGMHPREVMLKLTREHRITRPCCEFPFRFLVLVSHAE